MTYKQFIDNYLRKSVSIKDVPILTQDIFDGDGTTLTFRTNEVPIIESSYTVKIGGTVKTETTHYTLDLDSGLLLFTAGNAPASGNDNVTIDYKYAKMRDSDFLEAINAGIRHFSEDVYDDVIDDSSVVMVADQVDYDLGSLLSSSIFLVVSVEFREGSSSEWKELSLYGSTWTFHKESKNLHINPPPQNAYELRIRYLASMSEGATTASTIPFGSRYYEAYKNYATSIYWERVMALTVNQTSSVAKEPTFENSTNILRVVSFYLEKAEQEMAKIKMQKPPQLMRNTRLGKAV
jgi:hypothetical protein